MARYVMPSAEAARRAAARADLAASLEAVRCASRLLQRHRLDPQARQLLHSILQSLADAERAAATLHTRAT